MATHNDGHRLHSFDALRAAMMLLGLVLHTSASYTMTPLGDAWPYQDVSTSVFFDFVVFIIHLFRMPTFFVMAGFFAALLYHREGLQGYLQHRVRRLLLPMVVGWIVLYPITQAAFTFAMAHDPSAGWTKATQQLLTTPYQGQLFGLMHLWFIYYLFLLCLIAPIVVALVQRLPAGVRAAALGFFSKVAARWWGMLVLGAITAVSLIPMTIVGLDTPLTVLPIPRIIVAYGIFFGFGWLLYERRELVANFGERPWRYIALASVMSLAFMAVVLPLKPDSPAEVVFRARLFGSPAAGLAMWFWIYGITGLFVRYLHLPRPIQRYFSDGAYWMYLVHLPFAIGFAGLLAPYHWSAFIKDGLILAATGFVTIGSYYAFVRSTAIGHFLNGRRYPRALPEMTTAGS